ncbi:MAG: Redoxin domain protein [Firmicutes bacterium]|nr:Redoxin domain protein [Bacillota bacterium]
MNIGKIRKLSCLVVLLLLTAAVTVTAYGAPGVYVGDQAPEFSLPLVSGENVQVNYGGKLTVLNFWAAWCSDCRNEMPEINDFAESQRKK